MADTSFEPTSEDLENVKLKCFRFIERKEATGQGRCDTAEETGGISSEEYRSLKPSKTKRQHQ